MIILSQNIPDNAFFPLSWSVTVYCLEFSISGYHVYWKRKVKTNITVTLVRLRVYDLSFKHKHLDFAFVFTFPVLSLKNIVDEVK